jgi:hypothetical protein
MTSIKQPTGRSTMTIKPDMNDLLDRFDALAKAKRIDELTQLFDKHPDVMRDFLVSEAVRDYLHEKVSMPPPLSADLMTRQWASQAVLRLGNGKYCKWMNARPNRLAAAQPIAPSPQMQEFIAAVSAMLASDPQAQDVEQMMVRRVLWSAGDGAAA